MSDVHSSFPPSRLNAGYNAKKHAISQITAMPIAFAPIFPWANYRSDTTPLLLLLLPRHPILESAARRTHSGHTRFSGGGGGGEVRQLTHRRWRRKQGRGRTEVSLRPDGEGHRVSFTFTFAPIDRSIPSTHAHTHARMNVRNPQLILQKERNKENIYVVPHVYLGSSIAETPNVSVCVSGLLDEIAIKRHTGSFYTSSR